MRRSIRPLVSLSGKSRRWSHLSWMAGQLMRGTGFQTFGRDIALKVNCLPSDVCISWRVVCERTCWIPPPATSKAIDWEVPFSPSHRCNPSRTTVTLLPSSAMTLMRCRLPFGATSSTWTTPNPIGSSYLVCSPTWAWKVATRWSGLPSWRSPWWCRRQPSTPHSSRWWHFRTWWLGLRHWKLRFLSVMNFTWAGMCSFLKSLHWSNLCSPLHRTHALLVVSSDLWCDRFDGEPVVSVFGLRQLPVVEIPSGAVAEPHSEAD